MIENETLVPYLVILLATTLIITYISKKNKSKIIAWAFTVFCGLAFLLYVLMLYNDLVMGKNDWGTFNWLTLIFLSMYIAEVYEVFGKIPNYGGNQPIK